MDHEELKCLAKQIKHDLEQHGRASATVLYNDETNQTEVMNTMERLLGKENLQRVDLKLIYSDLEIRD